MKTKFFLLKVVVLSAFMLLSSCSSDSNNEPSDPCATSNCQNGGECVDGSCLCPDGYYGENCQLMKTPQSVRITSVVVKEFDNFDSNGNAWDSQLNGSLPDIYISLFQATGSSFELLHEANNYYPSAWSPGTFDFPIDTYVYNMSTPYIISLYNYNAEDTPEIADTEMGQVVFYAYEPDLGFPYVRTLDLGSITVEVYLQYKF